MDGVLPATHYKCHSPPTPALPMDVESHLVPLIKCEYYYCMQCIVVLAGYGGCSCAIALQPDSISPHYAHPAQPTLSVPPTHSHELSQ